MNKLYSYVSKQPIYYYNTKKIVEIPETYQEKEVRGLWVSNVGNIDLPVLTDEATYKKELHRLFETCKTYNLNTIFFQVRMTNDAFYQSKYNPYSRYLTSEEGKEPLFDVLQYVITLGKEYDIEIHAWCNPYRVSFNGKLSIQNYLDTCSNLNFAKQNKEYIMLDKNNKLILNPGIPEVQDFIAKSMQEIVENYDVDGIHFDDYFYPYSGLHDEHNDSEQIQNQSLDAGDFRRESVNQTIRKVYHAIKQANPTVSFGISPFGIWKNQKDTEYGSNTDQKCSESYYNQYADTLTWIKEEIIDYVVPQIYWEFGHSIAPFADICDFWVDVCKNKKTKLYVGHGLYRLGNEGEFENPLEIVNQVKYANQFEEVKGNIFFTYNTFFNEKSKQGVNELKKLFKENSNEK